MARWHPTTVFWPSLLGGGQFAHNFEKRKWAQRYQWSSLCSLLRSPSTSMCQVSSTCTFYGEGGEGGGVMWDVDVGPSSLSVWIWYFSWSIGLSKSTLSKLIEKSPWNENLYQQCFFIVFLVCKTWNRWCHVGRCWRWWRLKVMLQWWISWMLTWCWRARVFTTGQKGVSIIIIIEASVNQSQVFGKPPSAFKWSIANLTVKGFWS